MDYPSSQPPQRMLIIAGGVVLVIVLILFAVISNVLKNREAAPAAVQPQPTGSASNQPYQPPPESPSGSTGSSGTAGSQEFVAHIATVGEERIYKADIDYVKSLYAGNPTEVSDQEYLDKVALDSAILQGAAAANLITLDPEFFNAPEKNQLMRQKKLQDIRLAIDKSENTISGAVISIWFANETPAKVGYAKAKEIAQQKITALHDQVKSGQITIEQAGEQVANDASLADLDIVYDVNAIYKFSRSQGEQITLSSEFDTMLWNTSQGGVTDVYLAKATPTYSKQEMDALYMFGQIKTKKTNGGFTNFNDWAADQQKKYALKK